MKIDFEIKDIDRDEVVDAMARALLGKWVEVYDETTGPYGDYLATKLAKALESAVKERIGKLAEEMVRSHFDDVIKARIDAAVDAVLAAGWQETNRYGEAAGVKLDLKARIGQQITGKDSYSHKSRIDELVEKTVRDVTHGEFNKEIEAAKAKVRQQLDAVLSGKVAEALKQAMGLKS